MCQKTNMWKSIPGSSRSMEQIKLLMVEILNLNSCSVFGEKEPRGEMKIWTASTGSEGRRPVCSRSRDLWRRAPCHVRSTSEAPLGTTKDLHGVETWYLDAMMHGVDPLGPFLHLSFLGVQLWIFLKKKSQIVKNWATQAAFAFSWHFDWWHHLNCARHEEHERCNFVFFRGLIFAFSRLRNLSCADDMNHTTLSTLLFYLGALRIEQWAHLLITPSVPERINS